MARSKPGFITKQIRGGRPVTSRPYKWGPGIPSQTIEFKEIPVVRDPFAQFQYLLTNEVGQILGSADGNYYLEPDRP